MVVMVEKSLSTFMNARIVGSGEQTLVLAHGYGGDQSVWDKVLPYLSERYRVLVFDWSFSGAIKDHPSSNLDASKSYSYYAFSEDLINLLDEMNLKSTVFLGHSMSGMIGCIASVKRPELFHRLILIGSSPRYINSGDYVGGFDNAQIDQILFQIESNYNEWAIGFASLVVDSRDPPSVEKFRKCLKRMNPKIAFSVAKTVFLSDEREIITKVMTPCTIIQTTYDVVVPNPVGYYMKNNIKAKSSVEIVEGAIGHFPHLTSHTEFLEVIDRVLENQD